MDWLKSIYIPMVFDNGLIVAIIAINMTVIGLTSLADKKTVIGVDYGSFLINEFELLGIRMYTWLIFFACVNVVSIFTMFSTTNSYHTVNFFLLLLSLVFAIYYFFGFIIIENKRVVRKIYLQEMAGLYKKSENTKHFRIDRLVGMNGGSTTSKKLSTNVISYFGTYNGVTEKAFDEVYGPDSFLYNSKELKKYVTDEEWEPYEYRQYGEPVVKEISFEFFKMYREVENQDRWLLHVLELFNGIPESSNVANFKRYKQYNHYRVFNCARVIAQIKTFGNCESLYTYKFLHYLSDYWLASVDRRELSEDLGEEEINRITIVEKEAFKELFTYICVGLSVATKNEFAEKVRKILEDVFLENRYQGFLSIQEITWLIADVVLAENSELLGRNLEAVLSHAKNVDLEKLQIHVKEKQEKMNDESVDIFGYMR